jgi:hypothetical protein
LVQQQRSGAPLFKHLIYLQLLQRIELSIFENRGLISSNIIRSHLKSSFGQFI